MVLSNLRLASETDSWTDSQTLTGMRSLSGLLFLLQLLSSSCSSSSLLSELLLISGGL